MSTFKEELKKGALVNFLGILGKIAGPTLLIAVNQLYGTAIFGIYITSNMIIEILISFLTNGFKDGALIYVSKYVDNPDDHTKLYQSLSNAFAWSISLGFLFLIFILSFAKDFFPLFYEKTYIDLLQPALIIMVLALPIMAFERIVIAGTQGLKIMKYEAIVNGGIRPSLLLITSVAFYWFDTSAKGIAYGYVVTQFVVFLYSLIIYSKEFKWDLLFSSFKNFSINKELLQFSIPQSLNSTLNRFITGIDILMLPAFGASALQVGLYGTGASIIREVRQIKLAFSAPFNPHVVKFHRDNDIEGLSNAYSLTSNWITSITIPVLLLLIIFNNEILNLISSVPVENSLFMLFLLPVPYFYSSFSLAGNIVVMTGHSSYVLMNSILIALLNTVFNILLIPQYGIVGAAAASSISVALISMLELFEANK
jgi:O-antigen/teichoic acid export membrane protein